MRISLSDIEPVLEQRIRDVDQQTTAAIQTGSPLPGKTPFHEAIRNRENTKYGIRNFGGCGVPFIMLPFFLLWRIIGGVDIGTVPVLMITALALAVVYFLYHYFRRRINRNAEAKLVALGLPVVAVTREEKRYRDLIEELSKAGRTTEDAARSLLREINALMGSYRTLEERYQISQKDYRDCSLDGREAMGGARIEPVGELWPTQERMQAQQQAIFQILDSVHASLTRQASATNDVTRETGNLVETINDLQSRNRAVEQAVKELVTVQTR